jgi:type I restriction enzyme S subunit
MTEGGDWDKLGRAAIWRDELPGCIHQNHIFRLRFDQEAIAPEWAELFVNSSIGREYFSRSAKQTTNLASINMTQLRSCPIPIPPFAEQQRIVAMMNLLMAECNALKVHIARAAETQRDLADAIVEKVAA